MAYWAWIIAASLPCEHSASAYDSVAEKYALAARKLSSGSADEGLALLRQLAVSNPWFLLPHWAIAEGEYKRGRPVAAFLAYKRYLVLAGPSAADQADIRLRLSELEAREAAIKDYVDGEHEARAERWPRVLTLMRAALEKQPSFPLPHRLLGIAHAALAETAESYAAYRRYLALDPDAHDAEAIRQILAGAK